MVLQKGDFILIDYTAKVKETGEVFDTTNEEIAKKEHLHKEGEIYEPKLIVVGEGWMLKTLDEGFAKLPFRIRGNGRSSRRFAHSSESITVL